MLPSSTQWRRAAYGVRRTGYDAPTFAPPYPVPHARVDPNRLSQL